MRNFSSKEKTIVGFIIILCLSLAIMIYLSSEIYADDPECKSDCSKTTDEIPVCHADCDGNNGCSFTDENARKVCTDEGSAKNTSVGNIQSYSGTHKIICCEGSPYPNRKANVSILGTENVVRITRIVFWRGKFVKLVVDMFN